MNDWDCSFTCCWERHHCSWGYGFFPPFFFYSSKQSGHFVLPWSLGDLILLAKTKQPFGLCEILFGGGCRFVFCTSQIAWFDRASGITDVTKPRQLRRQRRITQPHPSCTAAAPFEYERALWLLTDWMLLFSFFYVFSPSTLHSIWASIFITLPVQYFHWGTFYM